MTLKETVRAYFEALHSNNLDAMVSLFTDGAMVSSPFLGEISAAEFFPKVFGASSATSITVYDVLVSAEEHPRAVGYFNYDWTLKDGNVIQFDAADVFDFSSDGKIKRLTILYDTHPIRETVGDKYS